MATEPKTKHAFRRLTKSEAEKLGVKYSSKHHVRAGIKRITKRTKLISDRAANLENKKANDKPVENRLSERSRKDQFSVKYMNVHPSDYARIIKSAKGKTTQILAYGDDGVTKYGDGGDDKFAATPMIGVDELGAFLDRMNTPRGLLGFNNEHPPKRIDIRVRYKLKSETPKAELKTKPKKKSKHSKARGK